MLHGCVSDAEKNARTRDMAQASKRRLFGAAAGLAMTGLAAITPAAVTAQDATSVAMPNDVGTILCETDRAYRATDGWNPVTADLDCAADGARDYARENPGVGVLIHVAQSNFPNQRFQNPDEFGAALVYTFQQRYGVEAEYFLSQMADEAPATGITYHLGDGLIHGSNDGTEVKNLQEALDAMPEVASIVLRLWEDQLAAARQVGEPAAVPGG